MKPTGQIEAIQLALDADRERKLDECIAHDKRALAIEEVPRTRLHLRASYTIAARDFVTVSLRDGWTFP